MNSPRTVQWLGVVAGLSFLVLLFIAMPLKYVFHEPLAVRIVGGVHGLLFLAFAATLLSAKFEHEWSLGRAARLFGASLVPFGFLWIARDLRTDVSELGR